MRLATQEEQNYYCKEWIPKIAGTCSGTLIINGGGKTMWEDRGKLFLAYQELQAELKFDQMAVNVAAMFIPNLQHIFSLHHNQIAGIARFRKHEYCQHKALVHSNKASEGIDYAWKLSLRASTSGLVAVTLGKVLGYDKFILCGVPMDGSGYFYKPTINETFEDDMRLREIVVTKEVFGDSVKSMSGRTKDILGSPTARWITGGKVYA